MKFNLLLIAMCTLCLNCGLSFSEPDRSERYGTDQKVLDLFKAIKAGDYDKVVSEIEGGVNVNATRYDGYGNTLLLETIEYNQSKIAKYLIEKGADVNKKSSDGATPIGMATYYNNVEIVRLLAKSKANLDVSYLNFVPLRLAMLLGWAAKYHGRDYSKSIEIVKILVSHGASLIVPKDSSNQPALWALEMGDRDLALDMIDRNADLNAQGFIGYTLLHRAAEDGDMALGRLLLAKHAKPNLQTKYDKETPLHLAIKNMRPGMVVKLIIDFDADLHIKNISGETALEAFIKRYNFFSDATFRVEFDAYFIRKFGKNLDDYINSQPPPPKTAPSLPSIPPECNDNFTPEYNSTGANLKTDWEATETTKGKTDIYRTHLSEMRPRVIKTYLKLAMKWHPDKCKTPECEPAFKDINNCREALLKTIDNYIEFYGSM